MKDEPRKKKISLSFRVDDELNQRIEKYAKKANRSKSNFVITLLTRGIDDIEEHESFWKQ